MANERPALHTTPWCIVCRVHGHQTLTQREYSDALDEPDEVWYCPICGSIAEWDDENYDTHMGEDEEELDYDDILFDDEAWDEEDDEEIQ